MTNIRREKAINELVANGGSVANAMRKAGYSSKTARTPKKLTESTAFKDAIEPIVDQMIKERNRLMKAMSGKDLTLERHKDIVDSFDKLTKNIQLLSGGNTENIGLGDGLKQEEKEALLGLLKK